MNVMVMDGDCYRRYYFSEEVVRFIVDNSPHTNKAVRVWGFTRDEKQVYATMQGEDPPILFG